MGVWINESKAVKAGVYECTVITVQQNTNI